MAQYQTTVTATAKGSVTFQFTCIKCGRYATQRKPIEETEILMTYDRNINVVSFQMRVQAKAEQSLLKRLNEIRGMPLMKKCELIGGTGKCPHCGELQPWSKIGMIYKPTSIFMDIAIWLGIGTVVTVIMGIFGKFYDDAYLLVLPPVISSLVGLMIGVFSNKKYTQKISSATKEFQEIPPNVLPEITVN